MKINGASPTTPATRKARAGSAGGTSFEPTDSAAAPRGATAASAPIGIASIDALLALQAVGDPTERKRRAVGRASRILDVLDEVKVALIDGAVTSDSLDRLLVAVRDQREGTDDPKLEGVLDEIEIRAAVELAKLGR